ncbi:MAG: hypothetical protein OEM41_02810 [Ignavibacteria bacterium]|nr:hypothetical protein [Ignavibacteria bacterium]
MNVPTGAKAIALVVFGVSLSFAQVGRGKGTSALSDSDGVNALSCCESLQITLR